MITRDTLYVDLDLSFKAHPLTGDLPVKKDVDAVRQAIRNLVWLEMFDIPFDADKRSGLRQLLFEQVNQITESQIRTRLEWLIRKCEPRVELKKVDVTVSSDFTGYTITIWYMVKSIMAEEQFQFFAKRVR